MGKVDFSFKNYPILTRRAEELIGKGEIVELKLEGRERELVLIHIKRNKVRGLEEDDKS